MPSFGKKSLRILDQLHPDLKLLCMEAIERIDFSLICGYRNEADQHKAWLEGNSKAQFGQSPHNFDPALAFDFTPYPCDWKDIDSFKKVIEVILECALELDIDITSGSNFSFKDYPHIELTNWKELKNE